MKLKDLYFEILKLKEMRVPERWENLEVRIPNNGGGMGGTSATDVKGAKTGIDWNANTFFIYPVNDMVEKKTD